MRGDAGGGQSGRKYLVGKLIDLGLLLQIFFAMESYHHPEAWASLQYIQPFWENGRNMPPPMGSSSVPASITQGCVSAHILPPLGSCMQCTDGPNLPVALGLQ